MIGLLVVAVANPRGVDRWHQQRGANRNRPGIVVCSVVTASLSRGRSRGRGSVWRL